MRIDTTSKDNHPITQMENQDRHLALLKRTGLFSSFMHGAEISRASTLEDLQQAYRIVYDIFLEFGYISPNDYRMRIRPYEACGETATFIAKKDNAIIGVTGLILDSDDMGLPSDTAFGPELDKLRDSGIGLCEVTSQAVVPIFRKTAVTTELMRAIYSQAYSEKRQGIMAAVSPSHTRFYELIGFRKVSTVRSYSPEHYDPVVMMCMDMYEVATKDETMTPCQVFIKDYLCFKSPFISRVPQWKPAAEEAFHQAELLRGIVGQSRLLETCTEADRQALRSRWGNDLYEQVANAPLPKPIYSDSNYVPSTNSEPRQTDSGDSSLRQIARRA